MPGSHFDINFYKIIVNFQNDVSLAGASNVSENISPLPLRDKTYIKFSNITFTVIT